ncbi:amidase [Celeribacter sp. PS-C1]|uniref:amidase n=1 Tax=Celeribacter sp. PS-C1 TaxID=2820813 RepID=UPI001CA59CF3|nr:amidase [Celeribacter sp. PS-C1]MBW6417431.1 amidase [Celeribacter sp. PS-C1]
MKDMTETDLAQMDMTEAGRAVRAGRTTFEELTCACLKRAEETSELNAWERLCTTEALDAARAQDTLLAAGYDLGPLQGMPIGLKSNIAVAGFPHTAGSQILAEHIATRDADVTHRLKRAGAVILGQTNMHEFAWGGTTDNPHYGQGRNARDPSRIPAGSSGGSGAAVAAGSAMAALGTDTGGSVRLPAALNGIYGLRPGVGKLPVDGIFPLAFSLDTVGPMTRSARDAALLYRAMSGETDPSLEARRATLPRRLGLPVEYVRARLEAGVEAAFDGWLKSQRARGIEIVEIDLPNMDLAVDALVIADAAEPTTLHDAWLDRCPENYGDDVRAQLLAGRSIRATDYLHAQRFRAAFRRRVLGILDDVDMIVMPTLPFVAPEVGQTEVILSGHRESALTANMRFTALASCAALPALSLPAETGDGLPVGIQLIGRDGAESDLLSFAAS